MLYQYIGASHSYFVPGPLNPLGGPVCSCMHMCCMYLFVILQIAASKDVILKRFITDHCSA